LLSSIQPDKRPTEQLQAARSFLIPPAARVTAKKSTRRQLCNRTAGFVSWRNSTSSSDSGSAAREDEAADDDAADDDAAALDGDAFRFALARFAEAASTSPALASASSADSGCLREAFDDIARHFAAARSSD